jgi:hypothetical protein
MMLHGQRKFLNFIGDTVVAEMLGTFKSRSIGADNSIAPA